MEPGFRPFDVIVAGHVCLDIIPVVPGPVDFEPGTLVEVGAAAFSPGGAVANVGTALSRLGMRTLMVGKTGADPFGQALRGVLDENAPLAKKSIKTDPAENTSYTIVLSVPGRDRMFLHSPGANRTFRSWDVTDAELQSARHLHFGYPPLMESIYLEEGRELVDLFSRARGYGLTTSLDMSVPDRNSLSGQIPWRPFLENVLPLVNFFLPSIQEITFMLDLPESALFEAAGDCLRFGAGCVSLKLGSEGLYFCDGELELWQPCFPVEVVGTTGSGDATIAGFLSGILEGLDVKGSLERGAAVGALCCEGSDAVSGIPERRVIEERLRGFVAQPQD